MTSTAAGSRAAGKTRLAILFALLALVALTLLTLAAVAPGPRLGSCPQGQVKVASFAGAAECTSQ
jgi:uncharacterized membrane protein YqjE